MWENGASYFYVTGACEFRVVDGLRSRLPPDLVGVLTPEEAEELATDLRFSDWPTYYDTTPGFEGMNNPFLIDETGMFIVGGSCFPGALEPDECPEPFPAVAAGIEEWRDRLQTLGLPADGPMRVAAVLEEPPGVVAEGIEWSPWPLQRPIADFLLDPEAPIEAGQGVALTDQDEIDAMRSFRDSFVTQFGPEDTIRGMYVLDGDQHYLVYARDAAPVEDENGLVPWLHHFGPGD
jgi:hypothetical protein